MARTARLSQDGTLRDSGGRMVTALDLQQGDQFEVADAKATQLLRISSKQQRGDGTTIIKAEGVSG